MHGQRRQWWAAAVAAAVVLGGAGCSAGRGAAGPEALRDGLLTAERLPEGYGLFGGGADGTDVPVVEDPEEDGPEPLASMSCGEIDLESFVTTHAPPLEVAAVGVAPGRKGGRDGDGDADADWYGWETLGRYPSGGAAEVLAELWRTARRCAVSADTSPDGSNRIEQSVTAEPFGTGLLLTVTTRAGSTRESLTDRAAVLRDGDVLLVVQEFGGGQDAAGLPGLVEAAVAAYRDAAGG
ncbi:hypothetical protein [Kitasatospora phosalacinea]|uniref:Uncharacterized protein n=1 Tax=Kitasatospora phosalacinea TaxID=2065 RepID=A0A9W6PDW4_9ACTN|nr:hypothetical protein [Kitasatospora phosalacinea]GLW53152.1 hypothetical protein Kpho01_11630 [Kitasatospora phosalacinea]